MVAELYSAGRYDRSTERTTSIAADISSQVAECGIDVGAKYAKGFSKSREVGLVPAMTSISCMGTTTGWKVLPPDAIS